MPEAIPVIELDAADAADRGEAYGETARAMITRAVEVYREIVAEWSGKSRELILERIQTLIPIARAHDPDLFSEVEGIARGANRRLEDIFLLNARSEVMFGPGECTSLLALPEATAAGTTLLAQNWDWIEPTRDIQVCLRIRERGKIPDIVTFTEAGQVAKLGMNGAGLGLCANNLTTDVAEDGVPWLFLARRVLECRRLTEAMGCLLSARRAHPINFLIAHADGEGVDLETAPNEEHVLWPEGGLFAHANHFLAPCLRFRDTKPVVDARPSTYIRHRRASRLLAEVRGRIDEDILRAILSDHFDDPYAVCTHGAPDKPPLRRMMTNLSVVMNLTERRLRWCHGNPCAGEWREMRVAAPPA